MHRTEAEPNVDNLFGGTPPNRTPIGADWLNAVQEEIVNVILDAGLALKTANTETRDQLKTALQRLYKSRGRNVIINGAMHIAQRGASGAAVFNATTWPPNDNVRYLLDRWRLLSDGHDIVDVSQSTEVPDQFVLSCALDVETINKKFGILQVVESRNCRDMIGENVSMSFYAKVSDVTKLDNIKAMVVSWSGTDVEDAITSDIVSAWNAEDVTPTLVANWTAENIPTNLGVTEIWARYEINDIKIDSASAKNVGVFIWSDGFSDTLAKFLYITGVQLERNAISTEFEFVDFGHDLERCYRYYQKSYNFDSAPGQVWPAGASKIYISDCGNADHTMELSTALRVRMRGDTVNALIPFDMNGAKDRVTMMAGDGIAVGASSYSDGVLLVEATNGAGSLHRLLQYHFTIESEIGGSWGG